MFKSIAIFASMFLAFSGIVTVSAFVSWLSYTEKYLQPFLWEEIAMDGYKLKIHARVDGLGDPTCDMFVTQEKETSPNKFITQDFPLGNNSFCNDYQYEIPAQDEIVIWGNTTEDSSDNSSKIHLKFDPDLKY